MELPEKLLYKSGEASLTENGKATLRKVAAALNSQFAGYPFRVEGHTDSDPIRRTKNLYKSNWELSAARALEVVHFLTEQCGVDPKRVHAAAFGQYQPVVANTTAAHKQQNRRAAIVVLPQLKK
jgi:chemotaxis protein MotB